MAIPRNIKECQDWVQGKLLAERDFNKGINPNRGLSGFYAVGYYEEKIKLVEERLSFDLSHPSNKLKKMY